MKLDQHLTNKISWNKKVLYIKGSYLLLKKKWKQWEQSFLIVHQLQFDIYNIYKKEHNLNITKVNNPIKIVCGSEKKILKNKKKIQMPQKCEKSDKHL